MQLQRPWTSWSEPLRSPVVPGSLKGFSLPSLKGISGRGGVIHLDGITSDLIRFGRAGTISPSQAIKLYEESSIVATPVDWIAALFASIQPVMQNRGSREIATSDPVLDLLNRPSPFYVTPVFRTHLAVNTLLTNECGLGATGPDRRPPLEILPITPKEYTPQEGSGLAGGAELYEVTGSTHTGKFRRKPRPKNRHVYLSEDGREFYQIRGFSTKDNGLLRGQSPLVQLGSDIEQHILGGQHNAKIIENGGRMSLVFNFKSAKAPKNFRDLENNIMNRFSGANNAGRILVTHGENLDISEMGQNAKDMDFKNMQELNRMAAANRFRFPLALIFMEAATLDNLRAANLQVWDNATLPLAELIFESLTDFLLPRFGRDPAKERITYDPLQIQALRTRHLEQLLLRKQIGMETIDELRESGALPDYNPAENAPAGQLIYTQSGIAIGKDPLGSGFGDGGGFLPGEGPDDGTDDGASPEDAEPDED